MSSGQHPENPDDRTRAYGSHDPYAYGAPQPGYGPPPGTGQPGYGYGYDSGPMPYGSPYGQQPPPHYGYPPHRPPGDGPRTHAIIQLVLSIFFVTSCFVTPGGIAGAVLSGIALSKADYEPDKARGLLKWGWIAIGANIALVVLWFAFVIFMGVTGRWD